jgi:hypothetical protein
MYHIENKYRLNQTIISSKEDILTQQYKLYP